MTHISKTAIIHDNVTIGEGTIVEDYCIIGQPPGKKGSGELPTVIGPNSVIRAHTIIYAGNQIGAQFQTGNKANIREENTIGDRVSIGTLSVVEHHVTIGNDVRLHTGVFVPEFSELGNGCWLGPHVVLTNARYPLSKDAKTTLEGPHLEEGVKIGASSTLLPGVRIGKNTLVGAGSLVSKDLPPASLAFGTPAKVVSDLPDLYNEL